MEVDLYDLLLSLRNKRGVLTEDYDIYRRYLSKQLSILRKKLKLQCLDENNNKTNQNNNARTNKLAKMKKKSKKKSVQNESKRTMNQNPKYKQSKPKSQARSQWQNREILSADLASNRDCLLILLYLCERSWSYAQSIYEEFDEDNKRKYHHSNSRLKKAIIYGNKLDALLQTQQSFGYLSYLKSIYYLQTQQIELAFAEYWKAIKATLVPLVFVPKNSMSEKLSYFEQNISKQKRAQIQENVQTLIRQRSKGGEEAKGKSAEEEQSTKICINKQEIIVASHLKALFNELDAFKKIENKSPFQFTQIVLSIINKQGNNSMEIENYLLFEQLKLTICRQYLWIQNRNSNKHQKLYEFAMLCQLQIQNLDQLLNVYEECGQRFQNQIGCLRSLFEIYRKFFIAKIHYFALKNYMISYQIFEKHIIKQSRQFITSWNDFDTESNSANMFDFASLIDLNHSKQIMQNIFDTSQKLLMLSKSNYILNNNKERNDCNNNGAIADLTVCDSLYPLLTKPIMIDIAWNYVEYNSDIIQNDTQNQNDKNNNKASWFGGLFGGQ